MSTMVDLAPFQEAFARQRDRDGLTTAAVADRMGVSLTRAATLLGLKDDQRRTQYSVAVGLCRALNLWPTDVGV